MCGGRVDDLYLYHCNASFQPQGYPFLPPELQFLLSLQNYMASLFGGGHYLIPPSLPKWAPWKDKLGGLGYKGLVA